MPALSSFFGWIVISSAMGSLLVILILALKVIFKNTLSANWHYYIWFLLLLRLMLPFTPESSASMYNLINLDSTKTILGSHINNLEPQKVSYETDNSARSSARNITLPPQPGTPNNESNPVQSDSQVKWAGVFVLLWLAGIILLAGYTISINLKLWSQIRTTNGIDNAPIINLVGMCKQKMKITRHIPLASTNNIRTPALFGPIHSTLLIPENLIQNLSENELKYIILHELAHWKRKDIMINWITVILQILHWFNPVIWYGFYKMHNDCEIACDRLVLSSLEPTKHKEYGRAIIRVLEMALTPYWIPGTSRMMTQKSNIKRRIHMISNFKREPFSISFIAIVIFITVGIVGCTNAPAVQSSVDTRNSSYTDSKNNRILAGNVDVEGPGIVVALADGESKEPKDYPMLLVHDDDILRMVNELKAAGAEAISVNGERLISNSEIRCMGTTVLINGNSYSSPFEVKAIGNTANMTEWLKLKNGYTEQLKAIGLGITVEQSESLTIPKYKGKVSFKYAKPVE